MSSEKRKRTLHYKHAKLSQTSETLQSLLEAHLDDEKSDFYKVKNRQNSLTEDGKAVRFINSHKKHGGNLLLCQLVQFESGLSQLTIEVDDAAGAYPLNVLNPKDIQKKNSKVRAEFLDSVLYFGVLENHVIVCSSQRLQSKELEAHLNWFLMNLTRSLTTMIILSDQPTKEAVQKFEKSHAKTISLGSDVVYQPTTSSNEEDKPIIYEDKSVNEATSVSWYPKTLGAKVVDLLKQVGEIPDMDFDDALDDSNLRMKIELSFNRKTTKKGQKTIDAVASSLRHFDQEDVKITLANGGVLQGDKLKLTKGVNLEFINGQINESDLYQIMLSWLNEKVNNDELRDDLQTLN
ncbi:hypothetical protein AN392_01215 [Pseudoalteromonas sp. P1-16-1b]|uniref:hypothetical protein n=1 Tax=Pseudoalteromonas sp. P1-16-1b TaxID=1723757 RepID=UPI0006D68A23|nr:hypothetical protein [Pseudoalteromonas sp. P1-16-1b]KPZ65667.1 hypothetical protein AN392_01215 [Pseudoalteromonas sp. P1-16-1b]